MTALVLATVADLRNALQDQQLDAAAAQSAIDRASALARAVARQQFDFVSQETIELTGGTREVVLPQRPVVVDGGNPLTVSELTVDGRALPVVEGRYFYRRADRLIRYWPTQWNPNAEFGLTRQWAALWAPLPAPGTWGNRVQVTYSHGYTTCPDWLTAVVVQAAVALATNPQGLRSEQVGGITLTWGTESLRAPRDLIELMRDQLTAAGGRRGGAFSIQAG